MDSDLLVHSSDDEETLLMKENLLKIRLRKKQLDKRQAQDIHTASTGQKVPARPSTPPPKPLATLQNPFASPKSATAGSISNIQVPGSPSPQRRRPPPVSPARILLGIDKGRTGRDVSLRRTPEKPSRTFNQRLADTKSKVHEEEVKSKQNASKRSTGFNPVPAFSSASDSTDIDSITHLAVDKRKVHSDDCSKAAQSVSKVFSILQFYAEVNPPTWEMSEAIEDYIVYGIVASKSPAKTASNGAKYCILSLTDLKTDIVMFFYDSAFEKYWTLPIGTLCYFLNPQYQKPKASNTKLSLKMTDDTGVLEIGRSVDFGVCRSIKKDGNQCTAWVNSKKQEVCDFHVDLALSKSTNKRLEFASGTRLFDPRQPSKKKMKESEEYAQHAVFFGDHVTTMRGGQDDGKDYDVPMRDTSRLQKEADSRQREREVLARLMKNSALSAGHEYFETTDPNALPSEELDEIAAKERVFSATMLRKLGFDPTKRVNQTVSVCQSISATDSSISERELALQKNVDSVDLKVELGKGSAMFMVPQSVATAPTSVRKLDEQAKLDDDSDSDLEIVQSCDV
ncbi:protein of unknown function [Taphrina deformans PYCC 5710]|uniref:Uncharacterized protein n=1 Tax=Taphrina deformans (strain PYCC 5710 / ATCC 11124 / CBS 356.35 / IMI 108563 / JCM 9778 / NBRC 8474) TaxID=1097556 RepID=R4XII0_TAPDE|nr:protein of unknown function [Taphrina deformans PYCC 5710]|eukprot:CCG84309.1 protein of unknown function [Taphrina deformans PYCC 5710]